MPNNLPRVLGLIQGLLYIQNMKDFDKEGMISVLEEIEQILIEILKNDKNSIE